MTLKQAVTLIVSFLQQLVGMLTGVQAAQSGQATAIAVTAIQADTTALVANDLGISADLASILSALSTMNTYIAGQFGALAVDLAATQQTGSPVTLPTTPPTGYGSDPTSVAGYVWGYSLPGSGQTAGDQQDNAGNLGRNLGSIGAMFETYTSPWFRHGGTWSSNVGPDGYGSDPIFPIANILSTDTLPVFLDRESYWTGWTDPTGSGYYEIAEGTGSDFVYMTTITAAEFLVLRDGVVPGAAALVPPIWPGLAKVTLGTPVTLTAATVISGPMDGILIALTAVPPNKPYYVLGTQTATAHIGQVSFEDDNDDMEYPQNLSFANQVYCPQSMAFALACMVRCIPGVVGTATPWTIT